MSDQNTVLNHELIAFHWLFGLGSFSTNLATGFKFIKWPWIAPTPVFFFLFIIFGGHLMPVFGSKGVEVTGNEWGLARFEPGTLRFMVSVLSPEPRGRPHTCFFPQTNTCSFPTKMAAGHLHRGLKQEQESSSECRNYRDKLSLLWHMAEPH